jgi:hypothetical protein
MLPHDVILMRATLICAAAAASANPSIAASPNAATGERSADEIYACKARHLQQSKSSSSSSSHGVNSSQGTQLSRKSAATVTARPAQYNSSFYKVRCPNPRPRSSPYLTEMRSAEHSRGRRRLSACMYVCMYVMHVCMYVMHVCMHVCYACVHVCMCVCYACVCACMYVCICACTACMYVCVYVCMHVCMYACMRPCMHVCVCMCVRMHRSNHTFASSGRRNRERFERSRLINH